MVGISHVAFRELIRSYTPRGLDPLLFTEMLSTRRLPTERFELQDVPMTSTGESFFVPQLLGNEEEWIAKSIERLLPLHPWGFDINMGCPAVQTLRHNWGVRLLGDKTYAGRVVSYAKKNSPRPVSVKLRASQGREIDLEYLLDFTKELEESGADWLTLHCRSQGQGHRGHARWDLVAEIAKARRIPVVANGDIQTWEDAMTLVTDYAVDGAMIARAAIARPWILWQLAHQLGSREAPVGRYESAPPFTPEEEGREYFRAILRFSCLMDEYFGDTDVAMRKIVFFVLQSSRWLPFGHSFFHGMKRSRNLVELRDFVNDYAEKYPQPLSARAAL